LAKIIDGKMKTAAAVFLLAGTFALFGVIHSPLPSSPIVSPVEATARLKSLGRFDATASQTPYHWAAAYALVSVTLLLNGAAGTLAPSESAEEEGHPIEESAVPI
jgi:AGZA family xanthine/uracil permease-like MFS transporter